jgi:hypothetical protein
LQEYHTHITTGRMHQWGSLCARDRVRGGLAVWTQSSLLNRPQVRRP